MPYYQYHLFFCINLKKEEGKKCCGQGEALKFRDFMKKELKKRGLHGKDQCRAMTCSCLGRCNEGPVLVIYPEGTWYSYKTYNDISEIIEKHILQGKPVERLLLS